MILSELIANRFGLSNVVLTPAPRGFVAETYYADAVQGRHFVKIVKNSPDSEILLRSLPLLLELRQLGVKHIIYPIPTPGQQYSVEIDGKILVLFNFIDGYQTDDFPMQPYVQMLAQVHQLSDQIRTLLERETFDFPLHPGLWAYLDDLWTGKFDHPSEKALQDWALARHETITRDFAVLEQVMDEVSSTQRPFVLTHGDAAGNVIVDGEILTIVDWDTAMFAPRERDTWFHYHVEGFLSLYRQIVPDYEFDHTVYRYYLYHRYFEDMFGFFEKVLSLESSDDQKLHNLNELRKTCDDWLWPLIEADRKT